MEIRILARYATVLLAVPIAVFGHNPSGHVNFEKRYIRMMVPHHESGIEMFSRCEQVASHSELKQLCTKMRTDQEKGSAQMKEWYKSWFNAAPPEEMPMKPAMKRSMDKMKNAQGEEFEKLFLPTVAQHHQQAIDMAGQCLLKSQKSELKHMCGEIKQNQTAEKKQLLQWNSEWYGGNNTTGHSGH